MKVFFLLQCMGVGGVERQVSMLAGHLRRRGHQVTVEALHALDPAWTCLWDPASPTPGILFAERPGHAPAGAAQFFAAVRRLRRSLKKNSPHVVYATQGYTSMFIAWLATRRMPGIRLVWSLRGNPSVVSWEVKVLARLSSRVSPTVPLIIAASDPVRLCHRRGVHEAGNRTVIYDGIDVELFRPDRSAGEVVRSEWGVAPARKLIGLVARLDPLKGHDDFLAAAAHLARWREDVAFVCVGHAPEVHLDELRRRCRDLGLEESFIWAGGRVDMPAVYNALDILCSPSHDEGFNLAIGEAMACGVPCVATKTADPAGMLGSGGVVVPPHDPLALAAGLRTMLDRLDEVDSAALRRRITSGFSATKMLEEVEAALTAVL